MQAIDNVKPAPKTALEAWTRWLNATQTKLLQNPLAFGKKIEVKHPCPGWNGKACGKPISIVAYMCQDCMPEEEEC